MKDNRYYGTSIYQVLGRSAWDNKNKTPDGSGLFIVNSHSDSPWAALEHAKHVIERDKMQKTMKKFDIVTLYVKGYMDVAWCAYIPPPEKEEKPYINYDENAVQDVAGG